MLSGIFQLASMYSSTSRTCHGPGAGWARSSRWLKLCRLVVRNVTITNCSIFGHDLIGDLGLFAIELAGQEHQQAMQALQFRLSLRRGKFEIARDRGPDDGAELGLERGRIDPQAQFAVARAAVHPRLDPGRNEAAVVPVGRELPRAECRPRASGERKHLPHHADAGNPDADGAVVVGISQIELLEPGVIPGHVEWPAVLPHVEIAGIENVEQQAPDFVGIAGIDEGKPVQRMVGTRLAHL